MLVPTEDGGSGWDRWTCREHLQQKQPKQLFLWCFRCDSQLWKPLIPFFPHPPWKEAIFFSLWCWVTQRLIQEIIEIKLFLIFSLFSPQGAIISSDCNCSSFLSAGRLSEMTSVHSLHEKAVKKIWLQISEWEFASFSPAENSKWQLPLLFLIIIIMIVVVVVAIFSDGWPIRLSCENVRDHWALRSTNEQIYFLALSISVSCYSCLFWPHGSHLRCKKSGPLHWIQHRWTDEGLKPSQSWTKKIDGTDWHTWVWQQRVWRLMFVLYFSFFIVFFFWSICQNVLNPGFAMSSWDTDCKVMRTKNNFEFDMWFHQKK